MLRAVICRRLQAGPRRWLPALAPLLAVLAIAGCSTTDAGSAQPPTPHDLLLGVPSGYKSSVDTELSLDQASGALSTDTTPTRTQLSSLGYEDGAEKVSVQGDDYVVDLVFEFTSAVGPGSLIGFERSQLGGRPSVTLFDDGDVPGAQGIVISAVTRTGGRQVFCEGALFPLDRYVFEVEECADGPHYAANPLRLTRTQYEQAAKQLGLPVASPSAAAAPSATPSGGPQPT